MKPEQQAYKADHAAWDAKRNALLANIKGSSKSGKATNELESQLRDLEAEEPLPPMYQRILFTDATPEALIHRLATVWPSGAVCSDEAGSVLGSHGMGADSQMRNLSTLNSLWGGRTLNVDRRTSESFTLTNPRLSMALQVQRPTLMHFMERTGHLARGSGFFARFLLAVPESTQGQRLYKTPPDHWPCLTEFNQRIATLLSRQVTMNHNILQPETIPLSDDAKARWIEYHDTIEGELADDGDFEDIRDAASKIAENAVRLAGVFELIENPDAAMVSAAMMERAISLATWHVYEAKRFFNEIALPEPLRLAVKLDEWLIKRCQNNRLTRISRRDAQRGPNVFNDGKKLDIAIHELVDAERVRTHDAGNSTILTINPRLLE